MTDAVTRKCVRRALPFLVVAGIVVAIVGIVIRTSRPHWRTYAFPPDPKTGVAIAIDYPDGWKLHLRDFGGNATNVGVKQITFMPPEPTGVALWWRDHILRKRPPLHIEPRIELSVWPDSRYKHNGPDQVWKNYSPRRPFSIARTTYPLGPALEIKAQVDLPALLNSGTVSSNAAPSLSFHQLTVSPDTPLLPPGMRFNLARLSPEGPFVEIDPQFREMARRLRVTQVTLHRK